MKGSVGTTISIYHKRLHSQRKIMRMAEVVDLSREAKVRLAWIGHNKKQKNALVAPRFSGGGRSMIAVAMSATPVPLYRPREGAVSLSRI